MKRTPYAIVATAYLALLALCPAATAETAEEARLAAAGEAIAAIARQVQADLRGAEAAPRTTPVAGDDELPMDLVASTRRLYDELIAAGARRPGAAPQPLVEAPPTTEVEPEAAVVVRRNVPVRPAPDRDQPRLALAAKGAEAAVLQERGAWRKVVFANGAIGWLEAGALRLRRESGDGSALVTAAREFLGVPYVWGGASGRGVDCSGLVHTVMRKFGVRVPHSAAALAKLGQPVSREALEPGDLVFFKNTYKPGVSHVGIYVSGDEFIHASSSKGRVTVASLNLPYFVRKYAGARRLRL